MRPFPALAAVLGLALVVALLGFAGRSLVATETTASAPPQPASSPEEPAGTGTPPAAQAPPPRAAPPQRAAPPAAPPAAPSHGGTARAVAPEIVAPPPLDPAELERAEPREPLSELALALPPKPVPPDKWKGTLLHRPVAVSSARFEAMGRTVALAGIDGVEPDETCSWDGNPWPCGIRARTAFRTWLRGRSLSCAIPPESDRHLVVAACRLGKQDVGAWLVANGWARATAGGPYEAAGNAARDKRLGIFGAPPSGAVPETSFELPPSSVPQAELPDFDRLEAAPAGQLAPDRPAGEGPG
jgi:endonuclease YncB( thermonuclease family)